MRRRALLLALPLAAAIVAAWLVAGDDHAGEVRATKSAARHGGESDAIGSADALAGSRDQAKGAPRGTPTQASYRPDLDTPPPSLVGTTLDGAIRFAPDGSLVLDRDLRHLFDHLLTTLGEQDLAAIRARLQQVAGEAGDAAQAQAVLDVFERYLDYLRATESVADGDPASRLEALAALRREWLGDELADAFFGAEEAYARASLARAAVFGDDGLDETSREARLAAIDATLPPEVVQARQRATVHLDTIAENRAFEELGVDDEARFEARAQQYGEPAAQRLAELDQRRAAWDRQVERYRDGMDAIEADDSLSPTEREAAIAALTKHHSPAERRRLEALARIGGP